MKLNPIKEEYKVVLDRIQKSIPSYLTENITHKVKVAPEFIEMIKKGVNDLEFSEETRNKWKLLLESGVLDQEIEQENAEIGAEINAYLELEMAKAVMRKELPKKKKGRVPFEKLYRNYQQIKKQNDEKFHRN